MPRLGLGISLSRTVSSEAAVLLIEDFSWKSFFSGELTFPLNGTQSQLLTPSNTFSSWTVNADNSVSVGAAGSEIEDPLNTTLAWKMIYDNSGYSYVQLTNVASQQGSFSVFVKKGNTRYVGIKNNDTGYSVFDLDNEVFTSSFSGHVTKVEKIDLSGWFRISDYNTNVKTTQVLSIAITGTSGGENDPSDVTSVGQNPFVYLFGAQFELGPETTPYMDRPGATAVSTTYNIDDLDNDAWSTDSDEETGEEYTPADPDSNQGEGFWTIVGEETIIRDGQLDITGAGLVTNGSYSDDLSSWSVSGNVQAVNKKASFTVVSGTFTSIEQAISYTNEGWYRLTARVNGDAGNVITFQDDSGNTGGLTTSNGNITLTGEDQDIEIIWRADNQSDEIAISRSTDANFNFTVDGVEIVRLAANWTLDEDVTPNGSLFTVSGDNNDITSVGMTLQVGVGYSVTLDIARTAGVLSVDFAGATQQTTSSSGTLQFNFTAVNTNQLLLGGSFRGTLDNIVVVERNKDLTPIAGI